MNLSLQATDFAALSPLLILLTGALLLLLVETFWELIAKRVSFYISLIFLMAAFIATYYAPVSTHALLTPWLSFDSTSILFSQLFIAMSIGVVFLSHAFFKRFDTTHGEFYFLLLSATMGLMLVGSSANFLTLFLGLETLSISLYILCNYMKLWEGAQESAIKFFLTGSIAAAVLLYGIALIYGATGTTSFHTLLSDYKGIEETANKVLFLSGIALITLGIGFKAAIFPFHQWAPDVYAGAPSPVTAFLAVSSKAGAFAAFTKVFLQALPGFDPDWNTLIAWLAIPTLIYANYLALRQNSLRRFFAYSGISHAGFLMLPLVGGGPDAIPALLYYLAIYAFATLGAFAVIGMLDKQEASPNFNDLQGLFTRHPISAGIFSLCLLTLAGIPPTPGFFAKFYLFKVAFQGGFYALIVMALLTTILSAYYYLRIIGLLFSGVKEAKEPGTSLWPAMAAGIICCAALLAVTFYPSGLLTTFGVRAALPPLSQSEALPR